MRALDDSHSPSSRSEGASVAAHRGGADRYWSSPRAEPAEEPPPSCFLCDPDPALVFARDDGLFAMLGLGPLGIGYSLIATEQHERSMFDLPQGRIQALEAFTALVRDQLGAHWRGPVAIGEHGRVPICMAPEVRRYEPHCLHAHRLVFPGIEELDLRLLVAGVMEHETYASAHKAARHQISGAYLYSQRSDGSCQVAAAPRSLPRQALRRLAAVANGTPELADWRLHPGLGLVAQAQSALGLRARI